MSKDKTVFVCSSCGGEHFAWQGRCQFCGEWNTLRELRAKNEKLKTGINISKNPAEIIKLDKVKLKDFSRIKTGFGEVDRVLGDGIVPGSVILLGGEPGIGKSTLLLGLANKIKNTLYISGEESAQQIKLRSERLGIIKSNFNLLIETDVGEIINQISKIKSQNLGLVIIDSIQTMFVADFPSTAGSQVQVRESALRLQQIAKTLHIAIILVGHVTKGGEVAGPKTLEHMVDVVLYLEGDRYHNYRVLRGTKNRFGATDEIGIFDMEETGLVEVKNPSKIFLDDSGKNIPGSAISVTLEGTRPLLVEIEALTTATNFGFPKRTASGFDLNRLNLLVAVLTKRAGLNLASQDIYLNVSGGFKIKDPAVDLAVCAAIASSFKNKPIDKKLCLFGEVSLSGEIRHVREEKKRAGEIKRLGYKILDKNIRNLYQLVREIM